MDNAKVAIQQGSVSLSAEGSESFVREALELWDKLLTTSTPQAPSRRTQEQADQNETAALSSGSSVSQYDHVFDFADDKLKIIAAIPGRSKAEQTRNVALLIMFGYYLQGTEHVASDVIRSACVDQGCYDATNFAGYLKGLKSAIVMNTKSGGQYDVKLTAPGRRDAKELAEQLQAGDE